MGTVNVKSSGREWIFVFNISILKFKVTFSKYDMSNRKTLKS